MLLDRISVRKDFSPAFWIGINCMSLAVWLGEDRKCSAAVVGLGPIRTSDKSVVIRRNE